MNMQHDESTFTKETINVQNEHCVKSTDHGKSFELKKNVDIQNCSSDHLNYLSRSLHL